MSLDLSSLNNSISSIVNRFSTYSSNNKNESLDVKDQIRNYASNLLKSRKNLANYMKSDNDSLGTLKNNEVESSILKAVSKMKTTSGMSSIQKYKYMMEQAKNMEQVDLTEPDAEKLLSQSENIIQKALLTQGTNSINSVNLNKAITAKQVALSRLDMFS